jgi:hypothetical protein
VQAHKVLLIIKAQAKFFYFFFATLCCYVMLCFFLYFIHTHHRKITREQNEKRERERERERCIHGMIGGGRKDESRGKKSVQHFVLQATADIELCTSTLRLKAQNEKINLI